MTVGYYEWGNPKKETLVLLHGMGATALSYGEMAKYLTEQFHVVAIDLPGHGEGEKFDTEEEYLPSNIARYLESKFNEYHLDQFILAGHSWGAHLALYYAKAYPNRVQRIVLLDGGYIQNYEIPNGSLEEQLKQLDDFYEMVRFPSWDAFWESEKSEVPEWSEELEAASRVQVVELDGEIRLAVTPHTTKALVKGIYAEETGNVFTQIAQPVLLLRSSLPEEIEELRQKAAHNLKSKIKNVEVRIVPNTTHSLYREAPVLVANEVKTWLQDLIHNEGVK